VKRLAILVGTATFLVVVAVVFRQVLVPFVVALALAYVLHPAVEWIHRKKIKKFRMPRWAAVLVLYSLLFGAMTVFGTTLMPRLAAETAALVRAVPAVIDQIRTQWIPHAENWLGASVGSLLGREEPLEDPTAEAIIPPPPRIRIVETTNGYEVVLPHEGLMVEQVDDGRYRIGAVRRPPPLGLFGLRRQLNTALDRVLAQGEHHALTAIRYTQRALFLTVEFLFSAILSLMLAGFILATTPAVMGFFRSLFPPRLRPAFEQLMRRVDRGLGGVVRGQLMICLINGVLSGIGFALAGLRYWPVWTVLATVASLVPIFGTIVSSVPAVAVGLAQGWGTGLFVLLWIVVIHELEANIFNPKIMGDAARMHPVIVVFALLAGAHAGGVLGALMGVPVASIFQSLFRFLRARAYDEDDSVEADAVEVGERVSR
jgi:predicted PurR-regulated permease PerM